MRVLKQVSQNWAAAGKRGVSWLHAALHLTWLRVGTEDERMSLSPQAHRPAASVLAASMSYLIWGLFPLYWKLLRDVQALELIAHRVLWALTFLLLIVGLQKKLPSLFQAVLWRNGGGWLALSGGLLSINWLLYVWGVNTGHVIECSLGYFLVPLINVVLGRFVLHETLKPVQRLAIVFAAAGVIAMMWVVGRPPWIALAIALTFGFYGLLRKRSALGPLLGLTGETLILAPLAGGFLLFLAADGNGALGHGDLLTTALFVSTGVVTAIPLLLFAKGARGLKLTTLGLLQYIAPTCQFLLGWLVYGEPLTNARAWAFVLIWIGLLLYSADAILGQRTKEAGGTSE